MKEQRQQTMNTLSHTRHTTHYQPRPATNVAIPLLTLRILLVRESLAHIKSTLNNLKPHDVIRTRVAFFFFGESTYR